jgi:hypothetical protein
MSLKRQECRNIYIYIYIYTHIHTYHISQPIRRTLIFSLEILEEIMMNVC